MKRSISILHVYFPFPFQFNMGDFLIGNASTVVERETEGSSVGEAPLCTACEMAVVWMQNQLKQKGTKERVLEYVDQLGQQQKIHSDSVSSIRWSSPTPGLGTSRYISKASIAGLPPNIRKKNSTCTVAELMCKYRTETLITLKSETRNWVLVDLFSIFAGEQVRFNRSCYDDVHGGFGLGDRNGGGVSLLEFARAFGIVIANSRFLKNEEHLVTFRSSVAKTQIDFLLLRKVDNGLCKDCKVIPREYLTTRHKLLVMDLEIKMEKKMRVVDGRLRIKWVSLTMASAKEMRERLMAKGVWGGSGDATDIWDRTTNCIREVAREVFGVSRGSRGGHHMTGSGMVKFKKRWKRRKRGMLNW
ncbi:hypothetical protein RND71_041250 [Anisodus tanguticus]|uniref:Saposin-like type B region 1 domain-containing protein n=1 Tax=Anisodus tanguticus TaxID=243964 RepID=A0AAE1UPN0_9SOLA|nr:hypothetical protein RND71_041250 [Anisodus tanguticus]